MADQDGVTRRKEIWGSVEGLIRKDSLVRDEKGLSATVIGEGQAELRIKGYGQRFSAMIEAAAERGEPVIFQGHLLGSRANDSVHLAVRIEGPLELTGAISNIRRSGEGKQPYVGFWMMREVTSTEGVTHRIGTGINVYGADADALSGLREGDRVSLQGRHGRDGFVATSGVAVLSESEPDEPTM